MKIKLLIVLALLNLNVFAVEGMWEPSQMGLSLIHISEPTRR